MTPDLPLPNKHTLWYLRGIHTDGDIFLFPPFISIEVLGTFLHPTWGQFILFRALEDHAAEIHSTSIRTFHQLFLPAQEPPQCQTPPAEKSFFKTCWRKLQFFFTGPRDD